MSFKFNPLSGQFDLVGSGGGMAIGDPVTSGSSGSVLFVDSSGNLAQDNPNLTYSPTTNTLSVVDGYIRVVNGVGMGAALIGEGTPAADFVGIARISGGSFAGWLLNYDTSTGEFSFGPYLTQTSSTLVINESGANVDTRIEGDTNQNLLFIDASTDRIGVNTATPAAKVHVISTTEQLRLEYDSSNYTTFTCNSLGWLQINSTGSFIPTIFGQGVWVSPTAANAQIQLTRSNNTSYKCDVALVPNGTITAANPSYNFGIDNGSSDFEIRNYDGATVGRFLSFKASNGGAVWNEGGLNWDFRFEGDTDQNLMFLDASTDRVGIGTNAPSAKLDVNGNGNFSGSVNIESVTIQANIISDTSGSLTIQADQELYYDGPAGHFFLGGQTVNIGGWDFDGGNTLTAASGTLNLDSVNATGSVTVSDQAYGIGWNGSLEVPTKNAIYDKIESLSPGGGGNFEQATVNFGSSASLDYNTVVTVAASWVTSSSIILCTPSGQATADHDPEDYILEGITACVTNIVDGVSFDVLAGCSSGTYGDFIINCTGA